VNGTYKHFNSDDVKLRWPDQSLDGDWGEQTRLSLKVGDEVDDAV